MRKIFLTFTHTLREMAAGRISDDDLNRGFFLFANLRDQVMLTGPGRDPDAAPWFKEGVEEHPRLVKALLKAEFEGRAFWIREPGRPTVSQWKALNIMLDFNNFPELSSKDNAGSEQRFEYDSLRYALGQKGLPFELVC